MEKCRKIRHIVRLRQLLRRWRQRAATRCSSPSSTTAAPDVPAGHVAVCVGSTRRRFVVRAAHLNHPAFSKLFMEAEEEYGFSSRPGPLSFPCDESLFEHVLGHVSICRLAANLDDFKNPLCCCHAGVRSSWRADSLPLLHGFAEKSVA